MYLSSAKFKEHTVNMCRDILDLVLYRLSENHLWRHHFPHLHKRKKIFQKGKCHSSLLWKAFQISCNYFLLHRHLNKCLQWRIWKNKRHRRKAGIASKTAGLRASSPLSHAHEQWREKRSGGKESGPGCSKPDYANQEFWFQFWNFLVRCSVYIVCPAVLSCGNREVKHDVYGKR